MISTSNSSHAEEDGGVSSTTKDLNSGGDSIRSGKRELDTGIVKDLMRNSKGSSELFSKGSGNKLVKDVVGKNVAGRPLIAGAAEVKRPPSLILSKEKDKKQASEMRKKLKEKQDKELMKDFLVADAVQIKKEPAFTSSSSSSSAGVPGKKKENDHHRDKDSRSKSTSKDKDSSLKRRLSIHRDSETESKAAKLPKVEEVKVKTDIKAEIKSEPGTPLPEMNKLGRIPKIKRPHSEVASEKERVKEKSSSLSSSSSLSKHHRREESKSKDRHHSHSSSHHSSSNHHRDKDREREKKKAAALLSGGAKSSKDSKSSSSIRQKISAPDGSVRECRISGTAT